MKKHENHKHHDHDHDHNQLLSALTEKNITILLVLNVFFAGLEFLFGILFHSTAILSDAVHDSGDAVAIGLAWFFQRFSKKSGDARFGFGYQRFNLLGASITSLILITGSVVVLVESIPRLLHPVPVAATGMFGLAIFAILANGFGAWLLARGRSRNEKILNLHALEDVLGWLGVLLVSIVLHFVKWYWLDPLLSILIAAFILSQALPKFWGTLSILLEKTPENVDYQGLLLALEDLPQVRAVTQLIIWSLDGEQNAALIHLMIPQNQDFQASKVAVRQVLEQFKVCQSAIELDETPTEHAQHLQYENA